MENKTIQNALGQELKGNIHIFQKTVDQIAKLWLISLPLKIPTFNFKIYRNIKSLSYA